MTGDARMAPMRNPITILADPGRVSQGTDDVIEAAEWAVAKIEGLQEALSTIAEGGDAVNAEAVARKALGWQPRGWGIRSEERTVDGVSITYGDGRGNAVTVNARDIDAAVYLAVEAAWEIEGDDR